MPILDVEIVVPANCQLPDGLSAQLADAAGDVFGSLPGRTWVKLLALSQEQNAENCGGPPIYFFADKSPYNRKAPDSGTIPENSSG